MSYDRYMDIHAPEGTRVKFTANGGMNGEQEYAKKLFGEAGFDRIDVKPLPGCHTDMIIEAYKLRNPASPKDNIEDAIVVSGEVV